MKARLALFELLLSALCLWAAFYHTPPGALVRTAGAWLFRTRTTARPLLAYYAAGTLVPPPPALPLAAPVPPAQALGYGVRALRADLGEPFAIAARVQSLAQRLGSDDAGVLALFCGEEATRYASAHASSRDIAALARALPPQSQRCVTEASQALMLGGAYALSWPLPESARITSPFGVRADPLLGRRKLHAGVDLGVGIGAPVRAAAAGVVRRASTDAVNGRIVVIDHGRGVVTMYCHNQDLLVREGQRVARGQIIARSGNSGRSTGPHLHYQLDLAGEPVDPLRYRKGGPQAAAANAID